MPNIQTLAAAVSSVGPTFNDWLELLVQCQLIFAGSLICGLIVLAIQVYPHWGRADEAALNRPGSFLCRLVAYIAGGAIGEYIWAYHRLDLFTERNLLIATILLVIAYGLARLESAK
jgi:hypothetical protein